MRAKFALFLINIGFSLTALAAGLPWAPNSDNTPVQVFRQASDVVGNPPSTPVASPSPQPVNAAMLTDTKKSPPPDKPVDEATQQTLQDQINQLNQNSYMFQQTANYKIDKLNQHIEGLEQNLQQLNQALQLLNQEVSRLSQTNSSIASAVPPSEEVASSVHHYSISDFVIWGCAIVIILTLMSFIWSKQPKNKLEKVKEDSQGDYDYLGSAESIPAKLNLVRAYIAMQNFDDARKVLASILQQGDAVQRQEAENLASKIPPENPV